MINIKFWTFEERKPKHYQEIIFLRAMSYMGDYEGFNPRELTVEYVWELSDSNGSLGESCGYDEEDPNPPELSKDEEESGCSWKLMINVGGFYDLDGCYWSPVEEYWDCFSA